MTDTEQAQRALIEELESRNSRLKRAIKFMAQALHDGWGFEYGIDFELVRMKNGDVPNSEEEWEHLAYEKSEATDDGS